MIWELISRSWLWSRGPTLAEQCQCRICQWYIDPGPWMLLMSHKTCSSFSAGCSNMHPSFPLLQLTVVARDRWSSWTWHRWWCCNPLWLHTSPCINCSSYWNQYRHRSEGYLLLCLHSGHLNRPHTSQSVLHCWVPSHMNRPQDYWACNWILQQTLLPFQVWSFLAALRWGSSYILSS